MGETLANPVLFLYFTMMLKHFELSTVPGQPQPTTTPQPCFTATPYPFNMVVKLRCGNI